MNTQALQHALSQMLHNMQQQMADLTRAIGDVEQRLGASARTLGHGQADAPQLPNTPQPKSGGRRSAGWSDKARAEVAERMRDYWRRWRETKGRKQQMQAPPGGEPRAQKALGGRSTAGWTPQARAQAAARMRARWRGHKATQATDRENPCD